MIAKNTAVFSTRRYFKLKTKPQKIKQGMAENGRFQSEFLVKHAENKAGEENTAEL